MDDSVYVCADVIINENHESVSFGEIRKIYLMIGTKGDDTEIKSVEPVVIKKIEMDTEKKSIEKYIDRNEKTDEKEWPYVKGTVAKLANLFNIDSKDIIIFIKGS